MHYLLSVIDDATNPGRRLDEPGAVDAFNEQLKDDGHWVFAGGLDGTSTHATVVDARSGEHRRSPTARSSSRRSTSRASG